jgi:hypothetical protein
MVPRVDAGDYVGPTAVRATVLPARAAYLVADGSTEGLRRSVQEACTRWGGMTEPIIPVKPGGEVVPWWTQVASLARVDGVVNVDAAHEDARVAAVHLGLDLVELADIDEAGPTAFTVHPSAVGPSMLAGSNSYILASQERGLWEVVGAGDLTDAHLGSLPPESLSTWRAGPDQTARAQLRGATLVERTCSQFGEHQTHGGPIPGPAVVWATSPDSFEDCIHFWNLRALRPLRFARLPLLILPVGRVQHWMGFADELAYALERPAQFAPDVALCSASLPESDVHDVAALLGLELHAGEARIGHDWPVPTRKAPFTYGLGLNPSQWLIFERSYGNVTDVDVQLFRDITTVRFTSPVSFNGEGSALVRLSGPALEGLPRRPAAAELITKYGNWRHGSLQIATRAANDLLFEIHVPELPEVTTALLEKVTVRHELSRKKGQAGMAWLEKTDLSPLAQPGVFTAIRELTTPRSKEMLKELKKLRKDEAVDDELAEVAAHWGGRSERRYWNAEQLRYVPEGETASALERLCAAGWAERGLRVACGACGLPSFIPFAQAPGRAACPGCSSPADYEIGTALTVYYRLNSHLDPLSDQGVLPHLLAIEALRRGGAQSHLLPGVDLWFSTDDSDRAEVDLFGIRDGKILSGEVKTSASEFTSEQITRDVNLSSRLEADVHVLAATADIPEETTKMARQLCKDHELELVVLGKAELLPWG